jgi:hypothetical protein
MDEAWASQAASAAGHAGSATATSASWSTITTIPTRAGVIGSATGTRHRKEWMEGRSIRVPISALAVQGSPCRAARDLIDCCTTNQNASAVEIRRGTAGTTGTTLQGRLIAGGKGRSVSSGRSCLSTTRRPGFAYDPTIDTEAMPRKVVDGQCS